MMTISQGLFAGCAVAYSTERNHKEPTWAITALQANHLFLLIGATFAQAGIASAAFRLLARVTFFVTPLVMLGHVLRPKTSELEKKWIQRLNYGYVVTAAVTSIALTALGGTALGMGVLTVLAVKAVFHFQKDKFPAKVRDGFAFATKVGAGIAALGYGHLTLQRDVTYSFAFLATALFFGLSEYAHRPRGGEPDGGAAGGEQPGAWQLGGEAHHGVAGAGAGVGPVQQQYVLLDPEPVIPPPVVVVQQPAPQPRPQVVVMSAAPTPPPQPTVVFFQAAPPPVAYPATHVFNAPRRGAHIPLVRSSPAPERQAPPPPASSAAASSFLSPALPFGAPAQPQRRTSAPPAGASRASGPAASAPRAPQATAPVPASRPAAGGNFSSAQLPF